MKLLQRLLGIQLPTADDVEEHRLLEEDTPTQQIFTGLGLFPDGKTPIATFSVYVMDASDCRVIIDWDKKEQNENLAKVLAKVLYQLNEGDMKATMARVIMAQSENVDRSDFVDILMDAWENLYKESDEIPVVLPSDSLPTGQ
jgi:hypothetical protein